MTIFPDIEIECKLSTTYENFKFSSFMKTNVRRKVNDTWYLIPIRRDSYFNDKNEQHDKLREFIKDIWITYLSPFHNDEKKLLYIDENQDDEWDRITKGLKKF